jgi:malonyl CoA-acyl carrier protein transacylase/phosphopantetheinyl transferase (holo-ACP synthase)
MATASSRNIAEAEAPARSESGRRLPRLFPAELFLVTAETRAGLVTLLSDLEAYLGRPQPAPLHDLAFTVSKSYEPALECVAIVAFSHGDLRAKLAHAREKLGEKDCERIHHKDGVYYSSERLGNGKVAFLFPGENAQYPNMLAELCLNFPEIREAFDGADAACAMAGDGFLPSALNFPPPGSNGTANVVDEMSQWEKAVVLVYTANTGMSRLLNALHMRPDALLGHSFGQLSALEMAGVLRRGNDEERIRSAYHGYLHLRDLSNQLDLPGGRLLAVGGADRTQIETILARFPDTLRVAMENCPHQYVLCGSGPRMDEAIAEAGEWLANEGAICTPLPIRRPFHTDFFESSFPIAKAHYEEVGVHPQSIEVYSCATTEPFPDDPEAAVEVAARHWMSCVRFQRTIEKMYERGFRIFVDVGPRGILCGFVSDILSGKQHLTVALNRAKRSDIVQLLNSLGILAAQGVPMRTHHLHERWGSRIVDLGLPSGPGRRPRTMSLPLPTTVPVMNANGIVLSPPSPAPAPPAEAIRPSPPVGSLPSPAALASVPPAPDEAALVMMSYMNTMERFVTAQGELMSALVRAGLGARETREAPSRRFPLLGTIQASVAGESLEARRTFDVQEDLYLNDHALGTRLSTTDPSLKALPVMPLTFSLEVAAEAGAALFPDRKVTAIVDIRANRWIFFDRGSVTLQVIANRVEAAGNDVHVRVAIQQETVEDPKLSSTMVEATVVLSGNELAPPRSNASTLSPSLPCNWTGDAIYPRRTFHGPLFQGIRSIARLAEGGLDGTLHVLPRSGLLRSRPDAELEIDPLLVDLLGQAVWLWDSKDPFLGRAYLPFGARALRFYGPSLPPGTPLELKLRIRRREPQVVVADVEGVDSQGNLRIVIEGLTDREFPISPALHRMMMEPLDHYFADVRTLELALPGQGSTPISFSTIADFPLPVLEGSFGVWRKALAFLILSPPEREAWMGFKLSMRREILWLLGRAAAKDALRHQYQERTGRRFASADLILRNEPSGRPFAAGVWQGELREVPEISISHTEGMAVAVAAAMPSGGRIGVDTEKIRTPSQDLLDAAFSSEELGLLQQTPEADRSEWVFRFWCAKEAVGKALGSGVPLDPRELAVTASDGQTGVVTVRLRTGDHAPVTTFQQGQHVFAIAALSGAGRR